MTHNCPGEIWNQRFFSTRWSKVTWQRGRSPECLTLEFFSECLRRQTTTNPSLCSDKARGRLLTTQTLWTSNIDHTGLTCWCAPSVEYMMDKTKHNTRNRNTKPRLCQRLKKKKTKLEKLSINNNNIKTPPLKNSKYTLTVTYDFVLHHVKLCLLKACHNNREKLFNFVKWFTNHSGAVKLVWTSYFNVHSLSLMRVSKRK